MRRALHRLPAATALVVLAAIAVAWSPVLASVFIYDRSAVLGGQLWRLWSGHLVHFSGSHLGWNLLAIAALGGWIEVARFRGRVWLLLAAPAVVSLSLFAADPDLVRYGGLSGVATACAAFALVSELVADRGNRAPWALALAFVALKVGSDVRTGSPLFAEFTGGGTRFAPMSHLAGFAAGLAIACVFGRPPDLRRQALPATSPETAAGMRRGEIGRVRQELCIRGQLPGEVVTDDDDHPGRLDDVSMRRVLLPADTRSTGRGGSFDGLLRRRIPGGNR